MQKKFIYAGIFAFMSFQGYAQVASRVIKGSIGEHPEYIEFGSRSAPDFKSKAVIVSDKNQVSFSDAAVIGKETDLNGTTHYRLQQLINNIPVENSVYISHVKNGKVISQNGHWMNNAGNKLGIRTGITESNALTNALRFVGANSYKWQDTEEETFIKTESGNADASFFPKASMVYYNIAGKNEKAQPRLAYKFDIYAQTPVSRKLVYVDAANGSILASNDLLLDVDVTGTAVTGYSGTQSISTENVSGTYRLRETGRGLGIQTYNMKKGTNYNRSVDFTDADNNWNNVNINLDQYATDAHWGAEKTYDFYKQNFNRNSIDNAGFTIKSYVHYSKNYFNAFWDGSRMTYGDGNATDNYKPLTAIDVCGHEITHGLTSFTANLTYSNESGALNEGFSDVFGTSIEWFGRPAQHDWLIGGDFYVIRSMSNPNAYSDPDTYKGNFWYFGTSDNGGVHTNSGVLNFWYYLLTASGSGTNDNGFVYNVSGIGITKAQAIAYRTLTNYLVPSSNYADTRFYSIKSAEDLYGIGSIEAVQTKNAWDAVGVGGGLSAAGRIANTDPAAARKQLFSIGISNNSIYPNPAKDQTTIRFTDAAGGRKSIELIDLNGRRVLSNSYMATKGSNSYQLNLPAKLAPGSYMVKVNGITISTIVKQ